MSEFGAILEIVGKTVVFALKLSIDLLLSVFLVASCLLPWRIVFICKKITEEDYRFISFSLTFIEIVVFISCLGCLLPPFLRISFVLDGLRKVFSCDDDYVSQCEARCALTPTLMMSLFDCGAMFFSLLLCLSPFGRQYATYEVIRAIWITDYQKRREQNSLSASIVIYCYGVYALIDFVLFLPSLFSILVPTVWSGIYSGILKLRESSPIGKNVSSYKKCYDEWNKWFDTVRSFCGNLFVHAVIDFACAIFFLLVIISPLRSGLYRRKVAEIVQNNASLQTAVERFEFCYDFELRKLAFQMGLLSVTDIFLLPLLLPLFCTRYRYKAIQAKLSSDSVWGFQEVFLISSQAFLLVLDIFILLPTIPILYVTSIRWKPVGDLLQEDSVMLDKTSTLYKTAMLQLSRLLMDLLLLPFALLVFLSYRREYTEHLFFSPNVSLEDWNAHGTILINTAVLLHDFLAIPVVVLLTFLLNCIRIPCIYDKAVDSWTKRNAVAQAIEPQGGSESHIESAEDHRPQAVTASVIGQKVAKRQPVEYEEEHGREKLWMILGLSFVDIPFNLMALFIFITIWRSVELFGRLRFERHKMKNSTFGRFLLHSDKALRRIICEEFVKLLRDIGCLVPFGIILATFYRLPQLVIELLSKLSSKPLNSAPLFNVVDCVCNFPIAGSPTLTFTLQPNDTKEFSNPEQHSVPSGSGQILINLKKPVGLHVVSTRLWQSVESAFGSTLASAARAMLPLKLLDTKTIGLSELFNDFTIEKLTSEEGGSKDLSLWMKIDTGNTKKSTLLKKLRLLRSSQSFTMQVECFIEVPDGTGKKRTEKVVLLRIHPKIKDIENAMELGTSAFPETVFNDSSSEHNTEGDKFDSEGNFVNSFNIIVLKCLFELCQDLLSIFLVALTMLNPWRFVRMMYALLENEEYLRLRVCQSCRSTSQHMDRHLLQYRKAILPIINDVLKRQLSEHYSQLATNVIYEREYGQNFQNDCYLFYGETDRMISIERATLHPYKKLVKDTPKLLGKFGCLDFASLLEERCTLHEQIASLWFLRYATAKLILADASNESSKRALVLEVILQKTRTWATKIDQNSSQITAFLAEMEATADAQVLEKFKKPKRGFAAIKRWVFQIGLLSRNIDASRLLIKMSFLQAMIDIFFLLTFLILLVTVVRAIPLLRELRENESYWPTEYRFKFIVINHAVNLAFDIVYTLKFLFFAVLTAGTFVGFPSFLSDIPFHLSSTKDAADCAQEHFLNFIQYFFCEFLSLFFLGRTYRILFKSFLFIFFVPAACVAETFPLVFEWSPRYKFVNGLIAWAALLAGSIAVTVTSQNSSKSADFVNSSLLGICAALFLLLSFAVLNVRSRSHYIKPDEHADKSPKLTWSHILAVITGPAESLQLSAVILYFFGSVGSNSFGSVPFTGLLMWGYYKHDSSSYYISSTVACILVMVGGIMVTLPLAASGVNEYKMAKIIAFKESPVYDVVMAILTRILTVWILATLMRPSSCLASEDPFKSNSLSTDSSIACGGSVRWSGTASIALLTFFVITSSIIHADDANLLSLDSDRKTSSVKFAPLYVITVRAVQLLVCALCLGAFWSSNALIPLVPIAVSCLAIAFSPLLYGRDVCSFGAVTHLRSAGFAAVAWTAVVCISRQYSDDGSNVLSFDLSLYIGWILTFIFGFAFAVNSEWKRHQSFVTLIMSSGVIEMAERVNSMCELALADISPTFSNSTATNSKFHLRKLKQDLVATRSLTHLVTVVKKMEAAIPADRLNHSFMAKREEWLGRLDTVSETSDSSVIDSLGSENRADPFALLKGQMTFLLDNIRPPPLISLVSRHVFTVLIGQKIPKDVCWYIFDFFMDTNQMRRFIDEGGLTAVLPLRKGGNFTFQGIMRACNIISSNKAKIESIPVTPEPDVFFYEEHPNRESVQIRESNSISIEVADGKDD